MNRTGSEWFFAALNRSLRTMAQTALSMLTVGMAISDVDWLKLISISVVAGVISILTSFATGLPEATTDGALTVTKEDIEGGKLLGLSLDHEMTDEYFDKLKEKKTVNFRVRS